MQRKIKVEREKLKCECSNIHQIEGRERKKQEKAEISMAWQKREKKKMNKKGVIKRRQVKERKEKERQTERR